MHFRIKYYLLFIVFFSFCNSFLFAQSNLISGQVNSEVSSKSLYKVKLLLINNSNVIDSTFSNKSGYFKFTEVDNGNYKIEAVKKKYMPKLITEIILNGNETFQYNIYLSRRIKLEKTKCVFKDK